MSTLWLLLVFPLVWPWIAKAWLKTTISWTEMALNIAICTVLVLAIGWAGKYNEMRDVEILSGQVLDKKRVRVSCEHSYRCNCVTSCSGTGSSQTCTEICQTCYDHPYDVDWVVKTTLGDLTIDRVNRQGTIEPKRWSAVYVGEPVALENAYVNYVKAVGESLFHVRGYNPEIEALVPPYPRVYDYYRVKRVFAINTKVPDLDAWNKALAERLRHLGPSKQANVLILFVGGASSDFRYAVERKWLGAKKNDIVVLIGTDSYPEISWVEIISWAKHDIFNSTLRDALYELKTIERDAVLSAIEKTTQEKFVRRPMEEFEYLKNEIEPPAWALILAFIVSVPASLGLTYLFHRADIRVGGPSFPRLYTLPEGAQQRSRRSYFP